MNVMTMIESADFVCIGAVSDECEMEIRWEESKTKCNFEVTYHLYEG